MNIFLSKFQDECRDLAIEARAYILAEQNNVKRHEGEDIKVLEAVVQKKALTYAIVTMNLFAFKYLPKMEKGEICEPDEKILKVLHQAIQEISIVNDKVYKSAYSICMRGMRLSDEMSQKKH